MRTLRNTVGLLVVSTALLPGCSTLETDKEKVGSIAARVGVDMVCAAADLIPIPSAALGLGVLAKGVHAAAGLVQRHFGQQQQQQAAAELGAVAQRPPAQPAAHPAPLPLSIIRSAEIPGP